ncbi:tetratricopeptide repeat protein [Devosia aquimaris]|uniref:tetratricopeptide repeat protein n=1 Tax=Devosia aquimaris TaxID=2866214 RepID=UPI001CD15097|nr:tetratricopeptide repeat protein [Devosia sp. CJK-A8-3]
MLRRIAVVCISIAVSAIHPTSALELSAKDQCAALAAYIWEPGFRETGIAWNQIDVKAALPACLAADLETPNDPPTLYRLGRIYLQQHDFDRALPLLLESAEAGYGPAQTAYGTAFIQGEIAPDYVVALRWLKRAAANGQPMAKANLATLYLGDHGLPLDLERYTTLTMEAALAGVDLAQYRAGWSYQAGYGVEQDLAKAEHWYRLSASQGYAVAQRELGSLLSRAAQDQSDHQEAFQFMSLAADQGDSPAIVLVGWSYMTGHGVEKDMQRAREYFERAYALGDAQGARYLGHLHEFGKGVPVDLRRAFGYYVQAAWLGNADAQYRVGVFLSSGRGSILKDDAAGLAWFLRAAYAGHVDAQVAAGQVYDYRFQDDPAPLYDPEKAFYWYDSAANSGSLKAALWLALYYGNKNDFETANAYVTYVLENGDQAMIDDAQGTMNALAFLKRTNQIPM